MIAPTASVRAYGFTYDPVNRLSRADFTQYNGGWNTSAGVNFSVPQISYDENGNIQSMIQKGLKVNTSPTIDSLTYSYETNSNQLIKVTDGVADPETTLGDFHDGTNGSANDYAYDSTGSLTQDANKGIHLIHYNYLHLPDSISIPLKGYITFTYDATGNKLRKVVTDKTVNPNKVTRTNYIAGFVYHNDTLEYFPTEEGRVRYVPPTTAKPAAWVYDYFEKDHLGNVRMVLTEETGQDVYAATMEDATAAQENALFDNVSTTKYTKPTPGFDSDGSNHYVSKLDGSAGSGTTPRVGPSLVLKVMAGDTITIGTYGWYQGTVAPPPSGATNLLNDLLNALTGQVIGSSHGFYNTTGNNPQTVLSGDVSQFFTNKVNAVYNSARPKAFLNWIAFDNQLKEVDGNSGVVQVPAITGAMAAQPMVAPMLVMQKNGYIYIYLSNESAQNAFFDNLVIHHNRGPILQEDHYYPFGLTMNGISNLAPIQLENRFKFNGKELNHHEFSDMSGLDWYSYGTREYDPQIGRFFRIDPLTDKFPWWTPYQFSGDMPSKYVDLDGMEPAYYDSQTNTIVPAGDHLSHVVS